MKLQKFKIIRAALVIFAISSLTVNAQQLKVPAASPIQTIKQAFALSDITIEYSRPGVKGRVIYGDLVPFGKVWRTGANASTKITFGDDVKIEGNAVPAGMYALYTIPNKDSWTIILSKNTTLWGSTDYKQEEDLIRFNVKPSALSTKVETFTINIADITSNSSNIELLWEQTRVAFNVVSDIDTKIMKNIEASVVNDNRPYYQAASYYYDNNKDLKQALDWVNKATAQNPKAYYMFMLKAKIQVKMKDNTGAVATANQVIAIAKEEKNDDYVKMAEKLIADTKK